MSEEATRADVIEQLEALRDEAERHRRSCIEREDYEVGSIWTGQKLAYDNALRLVKKPLEGLVTPRPAPEHPTREGGTREPA